ncbi:glycosyltransferase [Chryseobacterium sp. TY4]
MKNLLCFSHLGWNFVYQRPQHLMSRFKTKYNVYYFEEPKASDFDGLLVEEEDGIKIIKLYFNSEHGFHADKVRDEISKFLKKEHITSYDCWYYTPMALEFTDHLLPETVIFDSMDELSAFRFAPAKLRDLEEELFRNADLVFTGGNALFEAKKHRHHNIHLFPSSIDKFHFEQARESHEDTDDQKNIPYPRLGFFGVVDERFDVDLLRKIAEARPQWNFIIIGPVVKISEDDLPKKENIHYLGSKEYGDLPRYISNWDIALILFALNESTKFISPTKTPEYLSAGLPVISTAITDVINPYGNEKLVHIAHNDEEFITQAEAILAGVDHSWLARVDKFLEGNSWDITFEKMNAEIQKLNQI